jgi:hypothetical protein
MLRAEATVSKQPRRPQPQTTSDDRLSWMCPASAAVVKEPLRSRPLRMSPAPKHGDLIFPVRPRPAIRRGWRRFPAWSADRGIGNLTMGTSRQPGTLRSTTTTTPSRRFSQPGAPKAARPVARAAELDRRPGKADQKTKALFWQGFHKRFGRASTNDGWGTDSNPDSQLQRLLS